MEVQLTLKKLPYSLRSVIDDKEMMIRVGFKIIKLLLKSQRELEDHKIMVRGI